MNRLLQKENQKLQEKLDQYRTVVNLLWSGGKGQSIAAGGAEGPYQETAGPSAANGGATHRKFYSQIENDSRSQTIPTNSMKKRHISQGSFSKAVSISLGK